MFVDYLYMKDFTKDPETKTLFYKGQKVKL